MIFIRYPKTKDAQFRERYFNMTGEKIQAEPMESEDGKHYMVGSYRVKQLQITALRLLFPLSGLYFGESSPSGWARKVDD